MSYKLTFYSDLTSQGDRKEFTDQIARWAFEQWPFAEQTNPHKPTEKVLLKERGRQIYFQGLVSEPGMGDGLAILSYSYNDRDGNTIVENIGYTAVYPVVTDLANIHRQGDFNQYDLKAHHLLTTQQFKYLPADDKKYLYFQAFLLTESSRSHVVRMKTASMEHIKRFGVTRNTLNLVIYAELFHDGLLEKLTKEGGWEEPKFYSKYSGNPISEWHHDKALQRFRTGSMNNLFLDMLYKVI